MMPNPPGYVQGQRWRACLNGFEVRPFLYAIPMDGVVYIRDAVASDTEIAMRGVVTVEPVAHTLG